jgi:hypothetical protein
MLQGVALNEGLCILQRIAMKTLFKNPSIGQRIILKNNLGEETHQRIVEVTAKAIRVSSCNLYKFNRDGSLNKSNSRGGDISASIRPVDV